MWIAQILGDTNNKVMRIRIGRTVMEAYTLIADEICGHKVSMMYIDLK